MVGRACEVVIAKGRWYFDFHVGALQETIAGVCLTTLKRL